MATAELPLPKLDALPLGAHRAIGAGAAPSPDAAARFLGDEALFRAVGVRIAFTGRAGGVSEGPFGSLNCASHVGDEPTSVERNRLIVLDALGAPHAQLIVPNQVHGTNIVTIGAGRLRSSGPGSACGDAPNAPSGPEGASGFDAMGTARRKAAEGADAVVVGAPNVAALLNFADCAPLIIVSPDGSFAVAHAGWRGAVSGVASKAAGELAAVSGCDPARFNAYIGPHIRRECFEVGEEVAREFRRAFGDCVVDCPGEPVSDSSAQERRQLCGDAIGSVPAQARSGRLRVSLAAAIRVDLMRSGLRKQRIIDAGICTKCHPDQYFSYRATGGVCGRHSAVAVWLPEQGGDRGRTRP